MRDTTKPNSRKDSVPNIVPPMLPSMVFLGLKLKEAVLPIAVGNLIAGTIITLLTFLFKDYINIIIYALFAIAIVMLIVFIVKIVCSKPIEQPSKAEQSEEK